MIEPIEKTDPEYARLIRDYVNNPNRQKLKNRKDYLKNKIGRNDPCICGSGKKYKKCCLK